MVLTECYVFIWLPYQSLKTEFCTKIAQGRTLMRNVRGLVY